MRRDLRALGAAVLVESVVLFVSGETHFRWRVSGMLLTQLALWYGLFALVRRMRPIRHVSPAAPGYHDIGLDP
jgi:hypothetical protein